MACSPVGQEDRRRNQFEKICTMNSLANAIAEKFYGSSLVTKMDDSCGVIPTGSFEAVIDLSRAHQHLTELMNIAELRFACAVTTVLNTAETTLSQVEALVRAAGEKQAAPVGAEPEEIYAWFLLHYLDGMPCDHTKDLISMDADAVIWDKADDCHAAHWEAVYGDYAIYEKLLLSYAEGMLSGAGYVLAIQDHRRFTIRRS